MTTTPQDISWVRPVHRPQYTYVELHRQRQPVDCPSTTVNVNWATKPLKPPSCVDLQQTDARQKSFTSISANKPPCQPQPRRSDRKYRPWSWEMLGARFWPWLTVERHIEEELRLRHDYMMPHRRPLWPPDDLVRARPTVFAIDPDYKPRCVVPVRETCAAERPLVCVSVKPTNNVNFVNWQWLPHSIAAHSY